MNEVFRAAAAIQRVFEHHQWKFCFIGGLALQRWGEPRETIDVDVSLLTGFGREKPYVETLLKQYPSRIENPEIFAQENRVLLLSAPSGVGLDIALAGMPFEEKAIERSSFFEAAGTRLRTCSAEDLLVLKAFASRPRDWLDIEGILLRQRENIDWSYVQESLEPLVILKDEPEILRHLDQLRRSLS